MNVRLSKYWESLIAEQVASGQYSSASEVIQDALREWRERHERQVMDEFKAAFPQNGPNGEPTQADLAEIDRIIKEHRRQNVRG